MDEIVAIATELDMLLVLGVYHKAQDRLYTLDGARQSAEWVASRYKDVPNVVWTMYPEARGRFTPVVRRGRSHDHDPP